MTPALRVPPIEDFLVAMKDSLTATWSLTVRARSSIDELLSW